MKIILYTIFAAALGLLCSCGGQQTKVDVPKDKEASYENYLNQKLLERINIEYPGLDFKLTGDEITAPNGISIKTKIINHRVFEGSESFQVHFFTSHNRLFKKAIEERLAGLGENDATALTNGVESYLAGQFPVILTCIDMKHSPETDFDITDDSGTAHWHSIMGNIQVQGSLSNNPDSLIYDKTYSYVKPVLTERLKNSTEDFHWFRYYISRSNGEIIGDCYYDNEPCDEGLQSLKKYVSTWTFNEFAGQKQFIMLRKCGDKN
ncbi:MAG: hypothetical protein JWO44_667 [Bacteroidetes bacterium]|nr:hypothetical protein [Bacteroidota bacterium]